MTTNVQLDVHAAKQALETAGYAVTPYPQAEMPSNLIVRLGNRTVNTLQVLQGGVCAETVTYLISEQDYVGEAGRG